MRLFAYLIFIMLGGYTQSAYPQSSFVKVMSSRANGNTKFIGSGILVKDDKGVVYVLTSEHVVLHDNNGSVHQFFVDEQGPQAMKFLASDWGAGLALLSTNLPPSKIPLSLSDLVVAEIPAAGQKVMTIGFPGLSKSALVSVGRISSTNHSSLILADVEFMLEITGARGEFGMSGGAVTDANGKLLGLLAAQSPDRGNQTLYSIPISFAAHWAQSVLKDGQRPRLVRTTEEMLMAEKAARTKPSIWDGFRTDIIGERIAYGPWEIFYVKAAERPFSYDGVQPSCVYKNPAASPSSNPYQYILIKPKFGNSSWPDTYRQGLFGRIPLSPPVSHLPLNDDDRTSFHDPADDYGHAIYVGKFRPKNLLQFKNTVPVTSLVHFFRLLRDDALKPIAGEVYWDQFPIGGSGELNSVSVRLLRHQGAAKGELAKYLSAVAELTQEMNINARHDVQYVPLKCAQTIDREDIDFILNDDSLAADWQSLDSNAAQQIRASLLFLEAYMTGYSL